jgi:hypothetical protein
MPLGVIPVDITPSGTVPGAGQDVGKILMSGDSTITATVGPNAASPPAMTVVTVKVRQQGTAGNSYTLTETGNGFTVSGATFTGGTSAGSTGFTSTVSLAGKKVLVLWFDKRPGSVANPLLFQALGAMENPPEAGDLELTLTELEPATANIGDPSFTLHVHGTGFGPDSVIYFNGHPEPTTFVSQNEVTTGVDMNVWAGPSGRYPCSSGRGWVTRASRWTSSSTPKAASRCHVEQAVPVDPEESVVPANPEAPEET